MIPTKRIEHREQKVQRFEDSFRETNKGMGKLIDWSIGEGKVRGSMGEIILMFGKQAFY